METKLCSICFNETIDDPCAICSDEARNNSLIAVVEKPLDIQQLEAKRFIGRYHVLHGILSPRDGIGPDELRIRDLVNRVRDKKITKLVMIVRQGQQGDATVMYIKAMLREHGLSNVQISRDTNI